uniref:Uncharacterized protein n=1 Tax=Ditylenchus dipsaci TaxID=166011 RepID=A0A915DDW4_9BILA
MNSISAFLLAISLFATILVVSSLHHHNISKERVEVNKDIKAKHWEIQAIETLAGHENNAETVEDILKFAGKSIENLKTNLVLVKEVLAVRAGFENGVAKKPDVAVNELLESLPDNGEYKYGFMTISEQHYLYAFLTGLAVEYRDAFEKKLWSAKRNALDSYWQRTNNPRNTTVSSVVAVMRRLNGKLSAVAGLLVNVDIIEGK